MDIAPEMGPGHTVMNEEQPYWSSLCSTWKTKIFVSNKIMQASREHKVKLPTPFKAKAIVPARKIWYRLWGKKQKAEQ